MPGAQNCSLHIIIIADKLGRAFIDPCLVKLRTVIDLTVVDIESLEITSPFKGNDGLFQCAFHKLFFPTILSNTTKVIYLDVDTIVYGNILELWSYFDLYPTIILFAVLESNKTAHGWYETHRYYKKHFYPPTGINSGVLLMNLAMMRERNMTGNYFIANNSEEARLPDQDVFNSFAYFHQDIVGKLPCAWNKRTDSYCPNATHWWQMDTSSGVIHGNRNAFLRRQFSFWWVPEHHRHQYQRFCANQSSRTFNQK